ncbi:UDP-N-acetylmuramoyl-L-alanyl-D-glutamate--2,6-diaminopimelate ligase [Paenibacillaceae bacterium]|nr:UDP-N-acetylmuramoyl-L-alanyl-D-glutamate--2,6-diaminopimelate ligase [Paenibacillaceae bacterium]
MYKEVRLMWLSSIAEHLELLNTQGNLHLEVKTIVFDSREATAGSLFVAIPGFETDGHRYIDQAIQRGAVAIVVEQDLLNVPAGITVMKVTDSRDALARLSAAFYGDPTEGMNLIGVTGTNGKTSITYFIHSILKAAGRPAGLIGSMGALIDDKQVESRHTTPESVHLQCLFQAMRAEGINHCVMEVSSHALSLKRTAYSRFKTGIFTNLTPDHLELHQSMENYFAAKSQLFDITEETNIINADDHYGQLLISKLQGRPAKLISYGIYNDSDVYATDIQYFEHETYFTVHTPAGSIPIRVRMPGMIYVYNALAAIACAVNCGVSLNAIQAGLHNVMGVRGRMETVYQDKDNKVIVDFAHTEDGLEKTLKTIRLFTQARIILVFGVYGAEGEPGQRKRQAMGKVAGTYADLSFVTSDNPKNNDSMHIIQEIVEGIRQTVGEYRSHVDRKEAIHCALSECRTGDIVLIAGKGHETAQLIGDTALPFNEKDIVNEFMASRFAVGTLR